MHCLRRRGYFPADTNAEELRYRRTTSFLSENAATDHLVSEPNLSSSCDSISFRDFIHELGDNQSVSQGSITVELEQQNGSEVENDDHERNKVPRSSSKLNISPETRLGRLKQNGYHVNENIQESLNATNTERRVATAFLKIKKHQDDLNHD